MAFCFCLLCAELFLRLQAAGNRISWSIRNYPYTLGSFKVKTSCSAAEVPCFLWSSLNIQLLEKSRFSDPCKFCSESVGPSVTVGCFGAVSGQTGFLFPALTEELPEAFLALRAAGGKLRTGGSAGASNPSSEVSKKK